MEGTAELFTGFAERIARETPAWNREHRRKMQQWHLNYKTVTRPGGYEGRK